MQSLLTVPEVSEYLKFSEEHVRRLLRKKALIGTKFGSDWRIKNSDLETFVNNQNGKAKAS